MGLLNFKQLTDEEAALLFQKNSKRVAIHYTPEEKLENILTKLRSKNVSTRKFHFLLIEGDKDLHLYSGDKKFLGLYEKTNSGISKAREFSRNLFCAERRELKQGGYKLDLVVDNRQIDLTLGYTMNESEEFVIKQDFVSNAEFKRAKMGLIHHIEAKFAGQDLETKLAAINALTNVPQNVRQAAIDYFS